MIIKAETQEQVPLEPLRLRCPGCRHIGTFDAPFPPDYLVKHGTAGSAEGGYITGQRRCPNPLCRAHVFVIWQREKNVLAVRATYPPERIDLNPTEIPDKIVALLDECLTCRANNCFIATGMLLRKTLEALCDDQQATGNNLHKRIENLGRKAVLSPELLEGMENLKLLGNDAAHIICKDFEQVAAIEVDTGIDVTKTILAAVYQHKDLVSRLKALKKTP